MERFCVSQVPTPANQVIYVEPLEPLLDYTTSMLHIVTRPFPEYTPSTSQGNKAGLEFFVLP